MEEHLVRGLEGEWGGKGARASEAWSLELTSKVEMVSEEQLEGWVTRDRKA